MSTFTTKEEDAGFCPRCIEEYDGEDGKRVSGSKVVSACEECGVCEDCDHLMECKEVKKEEVKSKVEQKINEEVKKEQKLVKKLDTAIKFCLYALERKRLNEKMGYLIVRRNGWYDKEGIVLFAKVTESLVEWEVKFMNDIELVRGSFEYLALVPLGIIDKTFASCVTILSTIGMRKHATNKFFKPDIVEHISSHLKERNIKFYQVKV